MPLPLFRLWALGNRCATTALVAPLAIVLIAPKDSLQDRIEDVVRAALNEPGIVFEQIIDGLFETNLANLDCRCLFYDRHRFLLIVVSRAFPHHRGKNTRHDLLVPRAGATP